MLSWWAGLRSDTPLEKDCDRGPGSRSWPVDGKKLVRQPINKKKWSGLSQFFFIVTIFIFALIPFLFFQQKCKIHQLLRRRFRLHSHRQFWGKFRLFVEWSVDNLTCSDPHRTLTTTSNLTDLEFIPNLTLPNLTRKSSYVPHPLTWQGLARLM